MRAKVESLAVKPKGRRVVRFYIRTSFLAPGPNICLAPNVRRRRRRCLHLSSASTLLLSSQQRTNFYVGQKRENRVDVFRFFPRRRPPRDRYANLSPLDETDFKIIYFFGPPPPSRRPS